MYILKANTKEGVVYYMNVICVTADKDYALTYETKEQAEKDLQHFKNMFHYEEIEPEIEKLGE